MSLIKRANFTCSGTDERSKSRGKKSFTMPCEEEEGEAKYGNLIKRNDFMYKHYLVHNFSFFQQKGDFSNGITTIQCMYAPEFTSHSEGIRVKVE